MPYFLLKNEIQGIKGFWTMNISNTKSHSNNEKFLFILPFIILFLSMLVIHMNMQLGTGDDVIFLSYSQESGFSLIQWLQTRYVTWSSRTLIEALIILMVNLPSVVWRIADTVVIVISVAALTKLLMRRKYRIYYSAFFCLLFLMLPYRYMSIAGWIATTLNYMWPLTAGLIALYPIRKIYEGRPIKPAEGILYCACLIFACNSEQMAVVLLLAYAGAAVYFSYKNHSPFALFRNCKYLLLQLIFVICSFIYIFTCPGNSVRIQAESDMWLPEFMDLTFWDKASHGISITIDTMFFLQDFVLLAMVAILFILICEKSQKRRWHALSALPVIACVIGLAVFFRTEFSGSPDAGETLPQTDIIQQLPLIAVCAVIIIEFYILFGLTEGFALSSGMFIAALATQAMLGFSPTIFASGKRTSWIMCYLFIACIGILLSKWNFNSRRLTRFLCTALSLCGLIGLGINFLTCI